MRRQVEINTRGYKCHRYIWNLWEATTSVIKELRKLWHQIVWQYCEPDLLYYTDIWQLFQALLCGDLQNFKRMWIQIKILYLDGYSLIWNFHSTKWLMSFQQSFHDLRINQEDSNELSVLGKSAVNILCNSETSSTKQHSNQVMLRQEPEVTKAIGYTRKLWGVMTKDFKKVSKFGTKF